MFMKVSGILHLNAALYEVKGTFNEAKDTFQDLKVVSDVPLWRSRTFTLSNGEALQTFNRKQSEIRQTIPCDPKNFYLLAIIYKDLNNDGSSEIGYVPYVKWHKVYRSIYASGIKENFNDLGSYGLFFRATFVAK